MVTGHSWIILKLSRDLMSSNNIIGFNCHRSFNWLFLNKNFNSLFSRQNEFNFNFLINSNHNYFTIRALIYLKKCVFPPSLKTARNGGKLKMIFRFIEIFNMKSTEEKLDFFSR